MRRIPARAFGALSGLTVFYMHGLVETHSDPRVQRLHLTVDDFRATMSALKAWVRFVSIEEALLLLKEGRARGPLAVLTSDDGYLDNHDLLAPVARDLGIPWALFVSTHHIETGARFPTYLTRCFAYYADHGNYTFPGLERSIVITANDASRAVAAQALGQAIYRLPQEGVRALIGAVVEATGQERQAALDMKFTSDKPMSWAHVQALAEAGVEIGAHCHEHAILHRGQTIGEVTRQIAISKQFVEEHVGRCRYFAFPVGGVKQIGPQAATAAREAGFDAAFTTINGTLPASRDPFLHPRVMINRDPHGNESMFPFTGLRFDRALPAAQIAVKRVETEIAR
ncbi:MAG: polysaccharide deacetylase family protein [Alphaproteobacteria bacterium]|nr:polysaccharide deacetylase family protein [Alphaproteobacteria bacterium]